MNVTLNGVTYGVTWMRHDGYLMLFASGYAPIYLPL